MKKNIAIIVTNLAGSGAEKIALSQAKIFQEKGHTVVLFLLENLITYQVNDFTFPIIHLTNIKNQYKFLGKFGDKLYAKILQKKMNKFGRFDIVISNLPRADRVVKQLDHNNKYFVIHTSYKTEIEIFKQNNKAIKAKKKHILYKYLYKNENIITVAKSIISDLDELNINYKTARIIYNPFDFEFIKDKAREHINLDYNYIISASAFRKSKRYDILLDAFNMISDNTIKLVILAKENPLLLKMIKERNLENRVIILGFQTNPYKYISKAKLLVLSSEREGLPTVLIESLICNTPVVSTDCKTGPSEILTDNLSNWLVPINNAAKLAHKIDEALINTIEIKNTALFKFNQTTVYEKYLELF